MILFALIMFNPLMLIMLTGEVYDHSGYSGAVLGSVWGCALIWMLTRNKLNEDAERTLRVVRSLKHQIAELEKYRGAD